MKDNLDVRPSPIAGRWYDRSPNRLAESVDGFIQAAGEQTVPGQVVAVIAPHAGHYYSGGVAGYAFAALLGISAQVVAIVSPMHAAYYQSLLTTSHQAYETPLGVVEVDQEALQDLNQALIEEIGYPLEAIRQDSEHALEIELPFLQRSLSGKFRLLPIMVREHNPRVVCGLGKALAKTLATRSGMMVASTDLSHFYPQPLAEKLDKEMLRRIESFDPLAVLQAEDEGVGFACGRNAAAAVLWAASEMGADTVKILRYATSGDVSGDYSQVVGYGAAVVYKRQDKLDGNG